MYKHTQTYTHIYVYIFFFHHTTCESTCDTLASSAANQGVMHVKICVKPSLLEGCTDWHVATDLKHNFIFPTEKTLTKKRPDIVIWSVKAK